MIKGITIHNTGNDYSAQELYDLLVQTKSTNVYHYIIDEKEVVNLLSEDEMAYHTGKGYDFGNRYTLAIAIARSTSEEPIYLQAQDRAVKFIKKLLKKYDLTTDDIFFHRDFDIQSTCPHRIIQIYKTKERFLNECFL